MEMMKAEEAQYGRPNDETPKAWRPSSVETRRRRAAEILWRLQPNGWDEV